MAGMISAAEAATNGFASDTIDLVAYNAALSDEPFEVNKAFHQDPDPRKVNLGIGVYRSEQGEPWPLPVVQKAEQIIHQESDPSRHEYGAITGDEDFLSAARQLVFGPEDDGNRQELARVTSVQTISGTGANHLGAMFMAKRFKPTNVWLPEPTWSNHYTIWDFAGVKCRAYPYYNVNTQMLDFERMIEVLSTQAQRGDVIVLHACAHNPTGTDPTKDQWEQIAETCQKLRLAILFDSAYQGFATGDIDNDAWAIRHFFRRKPAMNLCVAQSFSKNFGLYGQRVGACHFAVDSSSIEDSVRSQLAYLIRAEYSMAPSWGAGIVKRVLLDPECYREWKQDLLTMSRRILKMRSALYSTLIELKTPGSWEHILSQVGMFSYTGLSPAQVSLMRQKHHIYMLKSGRISLSGLQPRNVVYVANCIDSVVREASIN
ncbi:unnamed protein product [Clonostachys byssicola]|uniref:Aspartate aminotransferase n=1 Tax=Clonostachys byssicola TaxID=160290 RepID=A0A9N9UNK1_9HYPO|nr:unnamed protein product [Clonostachys byssicola]